MPCLRYTWLDLMMEAHTYAGIFDTLDCLGLCLDHICTTVVMVMSGSFPVFCLSFEMHLACYCSNGIRSYVEMGPSKLF